MTEVIRELAWRLARLEAQGTRGIRRLAVDETSKARGHDYITLVADTDERRVLFVTEGKDAETLTAFADDLVAHGGDPQAVESVSIDMSPAFIKGVAERLPNAQVTFDNFHVIAHANKAVETELAPGIWTVV